MKTQRSFSRSFILLIATACLFACAASEPVPTEKPPANPFAWAHDGFFPQTNYNRVNGRLHVSTAAWGRDVLALAPTNTQRALKDLARRDGFSPNLPTVIAVPGHVAQGSVTAGAVRLLDTDANGKRMDVAVDVYPIDDRGKLTMLMVVPSARLQDGHTYLVVVSGLRDEAGTAIAPAPLAAKQWQGSHPAIAETRAAVNRFVPANERGAVQQAYTYTVGTNHYRRLENLKRQVDELTRQRPLRLTHTGPQNHFWFLPIFPEGRGAELLGTMNGWLFIDEKGEPLAQPVPRRWQVMVSVPESCPPKGCPVVIFGHGLRASKETMMQVAGPLNQQGMIVVSADTIWHETMKEPYIVEQGLHSSYDIFSGLVLQHIALQWQMVKLVEQDLNSLDLLPLDAPDGVPDADVTRIGYIGQSLGGIAGVSAVAHEPAIDAAIFNVTGGGMYTLFTRSLLRTLLRIPILEIDGLDPVDGFKASVIGAMATDFMDPLQSAGKLVGDERPLLLQCGLDDGLVPNEGSDMLARTLDLAYVGTEYPGKAVGVRRGSDDLTHSYTLTPFGWGSFMHHLALNGDQQVDETVRFFTATLRGGSE